MTSGDPSDSESNVSGFIRYSDKNVNHSYSTMIENMEKLNQDILQLEKNLMSILGQAGPMEKGLALILHSLPKPNIELPMDTD